jgi:prepilin-type N-terminal cleavage/methylation domain-containing protein
MQSNSKGFTVVEMLTAITLIAVTLVFAVPMYTNYLTETRTVEVISSLEAIQIAVLAPTKVETGVHACDDSLVQAVTLQSDYVELHIVPVPNDPTDPTGAAGFAVALQVAAAVDVHGRMGVDVARTFYDEVKTTRPGQLLDGVVTDSVVSFGVLVSNAGEPYCDSALAIAGSGSRSALSGAGNLVNKAPTAAKSVDFGTVDEDQVAAPLAINKIISRAWDADGDKITVVSISASQGKVSNVAGSGFSYTPTADFHGDVRLSYVISDGQATAAGTATLKVNSITDAPNVTLTLTAQQEVLQTGTDGRAVVPRIDTGGDMREMTLEFSVVGRSGGDANAGSGPVIFNYGNAGNNNIISAWRPNNLNIAFLSTGYDTGLDLTDGASHRVTVTWSSATGALLIYDNGVLKKTIPNVAKGSVVPGNGHAVIGQKMNTPASMNGWNANEHYAGQIFGASLGTQTRDAAAVLRAPLYSATAADGLAMDVRSQGGAMVDRMGHPVQMQGNFNVQSADVDTALALVPPSATLTLSASATPGDSDSKITRLEIQGLPANITLTDGSGKSGSGKIDVTNWNLGAMQAKLPAGFKSNLGVTLKAVATGPDGGTATALQTAVFRMTP